MHIFIIIIIILAFLNLYKVLCGTISVGDVTDEIPNHCYIHNNIYD